MAQENTQSDFQEIEFKKRARRRLVGSIALVLLMIVILPMVLEDKHEDAPKQDLVITIPTEDSQQAPATSNTQAESQASANIVESQTQPEATADKVNSSEINASPVNIQVGVFADSANVKQIQNNLEANGFKVQTSTYATGKIRVRVGPYATKAEADVAIAKLQALKFNPMIVND